jgi:hypothetical protein
MMSVLPKIDTKRPLLLFFATTLLYTFLFAQGPAAWPTANFGKYKVGFSSIHTKTKSGQDILISIWYPSGKGGYRMTLQDHITTVSTRNEDDPQQVYALSNPIYRINILSDSVSHHDFSTYGRVVRNILNARPSIDLINKTYNEVHRLILYFLQKGKIDPSSVDTALVEGQKFQLASKQN